MARLKLMSELLCDRFAPIETHNPIYWSIYLNRIKLTDKMLDLMKNINPKVDEWFTKYDNPQKEAAMRVREIILGVDERISEEIKWQAPTFIYKGNMASFFPKSKKNVSLMFHKGALIHDESNLLEGAGKEARTAKFANMKEVEERKTDLETVIRMWIKIQDIT